jgi:putative salt-induced outer membrane protein YdiY
MNKIITFTSLFIAFISTMNVGVLADEIVLENGDKLTGKFVQMEEGTLVFETDYAGKINIQTDQVDRMTTDQPVVITSNDGKTSENNVFFGRPIDGEKRLETASSKGGVFFSNVRSIHRETKPPIQFSGRANVGITNTKGNADTDQNRLDAELVARTEQQRFSIGGAYNREKADDDVTASNWKAYGLYDYFFQPKWFFNANTLFEHDEFADLDLRSTFGAGVGHQFFETDGLNLSVSAGISYIFEDYRIAENNEFPAAQWLVNYDQFFFDEFVQLFHSNNGFISLENGNNWKINTRQGLRFPIYKGLTTTLQYNYDYQNEPSPEAESKWDSTFLFLLGYQFGN